MTKSLLKSMAVALRRAAIALFILFLIASAGAIQHLNSEGDATLLEYVTVTAGPAAYVVAAVVAWTGSLIIRALARVRQTVFDALFDTQADLDP